MAYWLVKSEPETFSWEDLKSSPRRTTCWEGVRNYQARNHLRAMQRGDLVLFYHSAVKPQVITGIAAVVREAYPDHFAWDSASPYYDAKSTPENPAWVMVDIRWCADFKTPVSLDQIKRTPGLQEMELVRKGRLSVQSVKPAEWKTVLRLGGLSPEDFTC